MKRCHLKNLKKFANKFIKNEKLNIMKKLIYWQIYIGKYVPKHLISLMQKFWKFYVAIINNLKTRFSKCNHPNGWFWTSILRSNSVIIHTSLKRFICLKWILKKNSPQYYILYSITIHCRSRPLKTKQRC